MLSLRHRDLFRHYSGYKNLKVLAELNGKIDRGQILHTMELVGLNPNLRRSVKKYSLGMRQRLGIAQAIMEEPNLLVLDEPFNGLDAEGVLQMRKLLLEKKALGTTILLSSHNAEDIETLCDTVSKMEQGKSVTKQLDLNLLSCYIGLRFNAGRGRYDESI